MASLLLIAFLFICLFFLKQKIIAGSLRLAWVLGCIVFSLLIVLSTELFSYFKVLNFTSLSIFWVVIVLIGLGLFVTRRNSLTHIEWSVFQNKWLNVISFILPVLLLISTFIIAIFAPPNNTDAMVYHLSRVAHWAQNQSVANFATSTLRELYLNPFAEYAVLHTYLLAGSDRLVNLVQWFSYLNIAILVSLIAEELGAGKKGQYLAAVFALSLPQALLQSTSAQNDLVFSALALSAVYFLVRIDIGEDPIWLLPAAAATALAVLAKSTAFIVLAPFLVWTVVKLIKRIDKMVVGVVISALILAVVTMAPFFIRNINTFGRLLGPQSETSLYQNESPGIKPLVSNGVRNFAINLTYTPSINIAEEKIVLGIHNILKMSIDDPATSWQGYQFAIPTFVVSEDWSGSPIHVWLGLIALLVLLFRFRQTSRQSLLLSVCVISGFLLFSLILKWQPWNNRLQTIFFLLTAPLFGLVVERTKFLPSILSGFLFVSCIPYLFFNPTKPLTQDWNIFNLPRLESIIRNKEILGPYINGSNFAKESTCAKFGMELGNGYWEYPFWNMLAAPNSPERTLQHINATNESGKLENDDGICGIIVARDEPKGQVLQFNNQDYELSYTQEPVGIYLLVKP